ncbi:MAG: hypothetical protein LBQ40_02745 [Clostridiales bacterium]|jgi:uncharacterized membrane protein YhaH (DUF805 family)|nr:hypothetical protein [Clostridiales bacterium]
MDIINTYLSVFKKDYANFKGTETRKRYVTFMLVSWGISIVLYLLSLIGGGVGTAFTWINGIFALLIVIPELAIITRRLRALKMLWAWIPLCLLLVLASLAGILSWTWVLSSLFTLLCAILLVYIGVKK